MVKTAQLYRAKVMHKRLFPKENLFHYSVYYLFLPLPHPKISGYLSSFNHKDAGSGDGKDPSIWAREILSEYGLNEKTEQIVFVTMPRILGYLFNPVSFYLCFSSDERLVAVLAEVHNTFGEQHTYLCANPDHSFISPDSWIEAEKVFHVSPFLEREGSYKFRFDVKKETLSIWIDYYDAKTKKQLITSLIGSLAPLTANNLRKAFWQHPMVTIKVIFLIHWQALKLILKGIKYIAKPKQNVIKVTPSKDLKKK